MAGGLRLGLKPNVYSRGGRIDTLSSTKGFVQKNERKTHHIQSFRNTNQDLLKSFAGAADNKFGDLASRL